MTNLHQNNQNNFVSFIRHNQPIPPQESPDLEHRIMDSIEPRITKKHSKYLTTWTINKAIARNMPTKLLATGVLFTTVSFGIRTPRIAIEPKDLENFLVDNWQDTLNTNGYIATEENEAYWLLPTVSQSPQALSVSAP